MYVRIYVYTSSAGRRLSGGVYYGRSRLLKLHFRSIWQYPFFSGKELHRCHTYNTKSFAVNRSLDLQVIRGQARLLEKYMFLPSIFCLQQLCLATDSSLEWSSSGACKPRLQLGFGPYSEESFFLQRATLPTKQPSEP